MWRTTYFIGFETPRVSWDPELLESVELNFSGREDYFWIFYCSSPYFIWQLNFIELFSFLIKYCHIMFIINVLILDGISLFPVSSTVFLKRSVTGCDSSLEGGWMIFHFRLIKSIFFLLNCIVFFPSLMFIIHLCRGRRMICHFSNF